MSEVHLDAQGKPQITPPSSHPDHPLTPPPSDEKKERAVRVKKVLDYFAACYAGDWSEQDSWRTFVLKPEDYEEFEFCLGKEEELEEWVDDKLRYDYTSDTSELVVRMPTDVHDGVADAVKSLIKDALSEIGSGAGKEAQFARSIRTPGSGRLVFPDLNAPKDAPAPQCRLSPDAKFQHSKNGWPGVILEVAYTQPQKKLHRLAERYLLGTEGNVRVVIGLKLAYGKSDSREATLSMWRTHIVQAATGLELRVRQTVVNQSFRDAQGNTVDGVDLRLNLGDFANEDFAQQELGGDGPEIVITSQMLCEAIAEEETLAAPDASLHTKPLAAGLVVRFGSETPPEEIQQADEEVYEEEEEDADARMEDEDEDWEE